MSRGGRRKQGEHVNHERWLVSYADFITLMFAFFVLMYAIAMKDKERLKAIADSVRAAMGAQVKGADVDAPAEVGASPSPAVSASPSPAPLDLQSMAGVLTEALASEGGGPDFGDRVHVGLDERGLVIRLSASAFFDVGHAEVKAAALPLLDHIAAVVRGAGRSIRVEGHTDATPVASDDHATNWELSAARATWVVRYLVAKHGFDPKRMGAAAFAENQPLAPNDTEAGRAKNRRVEIVVLSKSP